MEEQTIIINDLLSFLWCKGDVVPRETLLKSVISFYSDQFATDALNSLLTALPVDVKRKQLNSNPFVAILDILEQLPKEKIPTLVCRNLNNVPEIDSHSKEPTDDVLNDEGIYTEHKRLVTELKSLNKSLFELSNKLHSLSDNSSKVLNALDSRNESDECISNDIEEVKEGNVTQMEDDSTNANEELEMSLIANRYQRALARRVEKGKDLKVKKIKPLLFDAENSEKPLVTRIISSSSPFYKIDTDIKPEKVKNISSSQTLNKNDDNQEELEMNEDSEEDEAFSDSLENEGDDSLTNDDDKTDAIYRPLNGNESGIGTSFQCPYCSVEFSSKDWLIHVRNCHGNDDSINPEDFYCSKCDIYFASKKVLGFHMGFHDNARPFECQECKYRFYTQKSVESHTKLHYVDFRHKCPFCYFQAYKLSRVKEHIRSHTGEKPYKCPMCDYATSSYTTLVRGHMHAHSNMRAFKCDECDKCYKTKSKLHLHMRCHSTEKIYKCSVCGMGFNKSYRLTIHFKGHLQDKTYGCSKCDFITKKTVELRKHMKENH